MSDRPRTYEALIATIKPEDRVAFILGHTEPLNPSLRIEVAPERRTSDEIALDVMLGRP